MRSIQSRTGISLSLLTTLVIWGTAMAKSENPSNSTLQQDCSHDAATDVVRMVNDKFGGTPNNFGEKSKRRGYITQHHLALFDSNHDGFIEFDEFVESEWSLFVPNLTYNGCRLTRDGYIKTFTMDKNEEPVSIVQFHNRSIKLWGESFDTLYKKYGVPGRGYLTKEDMTKFFRYEFDQQDRNHDGKLVFEDYSVDPPKK